MDTPETIETNNGQSREPCETTIEDLGSATLALIMREYETPEEAKARREDDMRHNLQTSEPMNHARSAYLVH